MKKMLFWISRRKILGSAIGFMFAYLPFLIPVRKIAYTGKAVAFAHPVPSYPDHVLIIPRRIAKNVFALTGNDFCEIVSMAAWLRAKDNRDYTLLINGGDRQDVMQAHFHLFTGNIIADRKTPAGKGRAFSIGDVIFWDQVSVNLCDSLY